MKKSNSRRWIITAIVLTLLILLSLSIYVAAPYISSLSYLASGGTIQNILHSKKYQVTGEAMRNALHDGQDILVDTAAYVAHNPKRGDVIVFHQPDAPNLVQVKRVIGLPGDNLEIDGTNIWINGVKLNEPYITTPWNPDMENITVPPENYFVMGDNRPDSNDSRYFGPVPKDNIVGKAVMVDNGPQHQWQPINTYPNVFANIK